MRRQSHSALFNRPLFILNPVAGTSHPDKVREAFKHACEQFGWQAEIHETQMGDNLSQVIKTRLEGGCDLVIAGGGDGTVSEVASALVGSDTPMAVIPLGTGNLLARQLKIPHSLEHAFGYLGEQPDVKFLNVMGINDSCFILNVSVGFSSAMIQETSREEKRRFGMLAYIWNGLRIFIGIQPYRFNLVVDDAPRSLRASEVYISDHALLIDDIFLKHLNIIKAQEGHVAVFVIKARTLWDYLLLIIDLISGRGRRSKKMSVFSVGKRIEISTRNPLTVQADGEVIGKTPVTIEIIKNAVRVLVPRAEVEG